MTDRNGDNDNEGIMIRRDGNDCSKQGAAGFSRIPQRRQHAFFTPIIIIIIIMMMMPAKAPLPLALHPHGFTLETAPRPVGSPAQSPE